jgi:PAS domain S-box-containing protein
MTEAAFDSPQSSVLLETLEADPELMMLIAENSPRGTLHLMRKADRRSIEPPSAADHDDGPWRALPARRLVGLDQKWGDAEYRLIGELGRGGTGIVYQAHQRAVDREVAIKVLRDSVAGDRLARERFITEARTLGSLDHPNVLAIHELGRDEQGRLFYSMKRVEGTAWSDVLDESSVTENLQILQRVADAIAYAHSRGVVHRDIKPENVMLGRFGEVQVVDWGLALSHPLPPGMDLARLSIGGTPAYMAPELARGVLEDVGPHTDIYLLGAVLYHIVCGFPPHQGNTLLECIQAAADNRIRPSPHRGELLDIALRSMATNPGERYQSVVEWQAAVADYQRHQESIALTSRGLSIADTAQTYEQFARAMALLSEALELWSGNRRARQGLDAARHSYAELALAQGDLDLAASLAAAAGNRDTELTTRIDSARQDRSKAAEHVEKLDAVFAHSPYGVLLTRLSDGRIIEANDTFQMMVRRSREELIGRTVIELGLWHNPPERERFVRGLLENGRVDNFELEVRDRNEKIIPLLLSARVASLDGESLVVAHFRDISARKVAEDELRRSQQRLQEIQELASLGTWEYSLRSGLVQWSDETYRIMGMPPSDRAPSVEEFMQMVHADDRQRLQQAIDHAIQHGSVYQLQIRVFRPDGKQRTVIARGRPISDRGQVSELYGTILDITERKAHEDMLRGHVRALQSMLDATGQAWLVMDSRGRLSCGSQLAQQRLRRDTSCFRELSFFPRSTNGHLPKHGLVHGAIGSGEQALDEDVELELHPQGEWILARWPAAERGTATG